MLQQRITRPFQARSAQGKCLVVRVQAAKAAAAKGFGVAKPAATPETCTCGSKIVYKVRQ